MNAQEFKWILTANAPAKDFDKGWTYYVLLNEMDVKIVENPVNEGQPMRFLSVAAAYEWAAKQMDYFSVLEMNLRRDAAGELRNILVKVRG